MFTVEEYLTVDGRNPFMVWFNRLGSDIQIRVAARIDLDRFKQGNFGDHKRINKDIFEARFFLDQDIGCIFQK